MPDATKYTISLHAKEPSIQFLIKNAHLKRMHRGTEFVRHCLQQSFIFLCLRNVPPLFLVPPLSREWFKTLNG